MTKACGREPKTARTACSKSCPRSSSTPPSLAGIREALAGRACAVERYFRRERPLGDVVVELILCQPVIGGQEVPR
eukprot:8937671-Alexandrium_andersonii.AAC.1